jgi:biotin synthase
MGAAWRSPKDRDMDKVEEMVREVKALGLETCATLGMLEEHQAQRLGRRPRLLQPQSGHRARVLRQRDLHPRISGPSGHAGPRARSGLKVCCGGIVGMGETRDSAPA